MACQAYQATYSVYPSGAILGGPAGNTFSQHAMVLPYLGMDELYDAINFRTPSYSSENKTVATTIVDSFLCPSLGDLPKSPVDWEGEFPHATAYLANIGSGSWERFDGMFYVSSEFPPVRPEDVWDGLSKTAMFSEQVPGTAYLFHDPNKPKGITYKVVGKPASREAFVQQCLSLPESTRRELIDASWYDGMMTMYNHQRTPNERSCEIMGMAYYKHANTSASFHSGMVHTAFADGHVESISDGVDLKVWRAMGSRDGGD